MTKPIQPIKNGRFVPNKIVDDLLEFASSKGFGLNELAQKNYTQEDREQFAQLIGYSLSGFSALSYVSDDTYKAAQKMSEGVTEEQARIESLSTTLNELRVSLVEPISNLYGIHPDDLLDRS